MDGAASNANEGPSGGVASPPVRRRSSVGGPVAVDGRRASHILTQTILHEKRTLSSGTNLVSEERLQELLAQLSDQELDNAGKVRLLVSTLVDELFTAAQIVALCGCTPSVKTHHLFMEVLVPRCVDPSEGSKSILALFRFQEDKEIVHEALKVGELERFLTRTTCCAQRTCRALGVVIKAFPIRVACLTAITSSDPCVSVSRTVGVGATCHLMRHSCCCCYES